MKAVLNEKGFEAIGYDDDERLSDTSWRIGDPITAEVAPTSYGPTYYRLTNQRTGDTRGLFAREEFDVVGEDVPEVEQDEVVKTPAPRMFADTIHFSTIVKIKEKFAELNAALSNNDNYMYLEVPEIIVNDESGAPFAKAYFHDDEVFVEPMFPLVRSVEDY